MFHNAIMLLLRKRTYKLFVENHVLNSTFSAIMQNIIHAKTRLLGRPQPQMYPPVALNQYTWVNRTHKHLKYICFKAPKTFWNLDFTFTKLNCFRPWATGQIYGDWYHHEALNLSVIFRKIYDMYIDLKKFGGTFISGSFLQKYGLCPWQPP